MKAAPNGERTTLPTGVPARVAMAIALIAAAIASLVITSLIHGRRAIAQSDLTQPPSSTLTAPLSSPRDHDNSGPFAFGHLEFDWNPAEGVPGFSSWPPDGRSK